MDAEQVRETAAKQRTNREILGRGRPERGLPAGRSAQHRGPDEERNAAARGAEVELSPRRARRESRVTRPTGARSRTRPSGRRRRASGSSHRGPARDEGEVPPRRERNPASRVSVSEEAPPPAGASQRRLRRRVQMAHLQGVSLGPPRRRRVHRHLQIVRACPHPPRAEHGSPPGDGLDDPGTVGDRQVESASSTWSGCCSPAERRFLVHGQSVPNMPDDDLFDMRKNSGCCSRTAPCSGR